MNLHRNIPVDTDGAGRPQAEWLSPAQYAALEELELMARASHCTGLVGGQSTGKSVILKVFAERNGGDLFTLDEAVKGPEMSSGQMAQEVVLVAIDRALQRTDLLVIDNMRYLTGQHNAGRNKIEPLLLKRLMSILSATGKRVVFGSGYELKISDAGSHHMASVEIEAFRASDYARLCERFMGAGRSAAIDFGEVFRFAPSLNALQLEIVCRSLTGAAPDTDAFIEALQRLVVRANVRTHEVEALTFAQLPGAEHIAAKLETHIILPLENRQLAKRFDIRPKRGVLLYGPPGTGKTSIGRALAHRMRGKFFLIDGTFPTEPPKAFFERVQAVIHEASVNSPCVLFIDDADVLFGIPHIAGFSRLLLSLLDGLESETASRVCLMMTAMDARHVPAAILRSGRVELWLETRLPDAANRALILQRYVGEDLPQAAQADYAALAGQAARFTPADLRRIASDARALHVADIVAERKLRSAQDYLTQAIVTTIAARNQMADNLNDPSMRVGSGMQGKAKYGAGIGGVVDSLSSCATKEW